MVQLFGSEERLHSISTIGLVATARWMDLNDLQPAIQWLNSQGIEVKLAGNIDEKYGQLAGTGEQKALEFNDFLHDPEVDALWAVRGGYGSVKMVERIDWDFWIKRPKPLIGFSDVTIIHAKATKRGIPTVHGEMLLNFLKDGKIQQGILSKETEVLKEFWWAEIFLFWFPTSIPSLNLTTEGKSSFWKIWMSTSTTSTE